MDTSNLYGLLSDLRDQLVDETKLIGDAGRRRRRRELLTRLRAVLAVGDGGFMSSHFVETARRDWASDARVHIDDVAPCRFKSSGVWIGAWIRAATGPGSFDNIAPERLAAAIRVLPPLTRDVFKLSCRDGLDYSSIGEVLAVSEDLVRRELAAALVAIDQALTTEANDDPSPIA